MQLDRNLYGDAEGDRRCVVRWGMGCQQTLSSLRVATGAELNGLEADPLFVDVNATPPDLHITLASPARDAAIRIPDHDGSAFGKDIDQQARSGKWDIGADEYRCTHDGDCDDGNLCNGAERCFSGVCGSAPAALRCDDDNPCTTDKCMAATGCQHEAVPDETTCDDADVCSPASACRGGICVGVGVIQCPPPDVCHLQGACDPALGTCVKSPLAPDGTACDDGNVCTTGDACRSGACGGHVCDDDPCTRCTANGCEKVGAGSFDAVTCAFRRSLTPPACSGQRIPSLIVEQFGAARAVLDAAGEQTACTGGRHSAYGRAGFRVQKALKKLDRTQRRTARDRVTPGCFSVLRSVLVDARLRAQSSYAGCKATRAGAPG